MNLASLRARLSALAAHLPMTATEWPEVVFPIVETGPTGPVVTGTLIRDTSTRAGWREVPPDTETQTTKGKT
jgi:hypothetical protein